MKNLAKLKLTKKILFLALFTFSLASGFAQSRLDFQIDSLNKELQRKDIPDSLRIRLYKEISEKYDNIKNEKKVLSELIKGYNILKTKTDKYFNTYKCEYYLTLSNYRLWHNNDSVEVFLNKLIELTKREKNLNDYYIVAATVNYSNAYNRQGKYWEALNSLLTALSTVKKKKIIYKGEEVNYKFSIYILNNLGTLYLRSLENYEKAKHYALECLQFLEQPKPFKNKELTKVIVLNNLGISYFKLGMLQESINTLNEAYKICQNINLPVMEARILNNLGEAYLRKKEYKKAIKFYSASLDIKQKFGIQVEEATTLISLVHSYRILKMYVQAQKYLEDLKKIPIKTLQNDMNFYQYYLHERGLMETISNQYKKAVNTYEELADLLTNHEARASSKAIADLEISYKTREKEAEIKQQEQLLTLKNKQFSVVLICSAILLIVLFFLYRLLVKIKGQRKQIALRNNEIIHNQKNNIQILQSIFSRQARELDNNQDFIHKNQERIYALQLVNDFLYSKNENRINLKDYVSKFCEAKKTNSGLDNLTIHTEVSNIEVESNRVRDIGLIINELITNSIKYAFESVTNPTIHISIQYDPSKNVISFHYSDNGIGISENKKDSFGLLFIKDLVSQNHGYVNEESGAGGGFTISFQLNDSRSFSATTPNKRA